METLVEELIRQNQALMEALRSGRSEREEKSKVTGVQFDKFEEASESFDSFIERFQAFLDIQNVPTEKRGKTLISSISAKLYNLLKNLVAPDNPADKDFNTLKGILKDHLSPKPLIIPSRHMFLNRKQNEGESISAYIAELRSLAIPCNYNQEMLNVMLRDVFVSGLRDRSILDRLFEEDDIDLDRTLKIALAIERASIGANDIIGKHHEIKEFSVKNKKTFQSKFVPRNKNSAKQKKQDEYCSRCTGTDHNNYDCKYKTSKCRFCQKIGHLEKACYVARKTKLNKPVKQKQIEVNPSDIKQNSVPMYGLRDSEVLQEESPKRPPIMITVKINNKPVKMEVDTGGTVSVMSEKKFREISKENITPTNLIFKTYKGETIIPIGYATVEVEYRNQMETLNLYIVKENLDTIFGREWLYRINLDWNSIKTVKVSINLSKLLDENKELFDDNLGEINNYECKLELKPQATPVFCRPRQIPFALKRRVEEELDRLENEGVIEKISISDWATPIVPIVKANGNIRLCADYSVTLNKNLKVQKHPLPRIEDIFSSLSDGRVFSKVDFSQAYLQMKVHPDSQKLLTINTHKGLYICKRLMYGINAAPAIWQKYIESVFQGLEGVEVFFDDARIAAPDAQTHFSRLQEFFKRCRMHGLKVNKEKSKFFQDEIEFLGYRVNAQGLCKTNEKISAIKNAKTPKNVQDVQSFMGLVNFYSRFSKEIATLAYPLHNLTKKDVSWNWGKECEEAFENVKNEICSDRILAHYDPMLPVCLSTDASPVGLGSVLSHKFPDGSERPIAFASRTLSPTEQRYSQIDKEALAIVWGVKKFYLYLKGNRFTLITDHKPLVAIFECKKGLPILSATRLLHYALVLQAYQFDIIYRNTKDHGNADFLSRLPLNSEELHLQDEISVFQMCQIETLPITYKDLARATNEDEELRPVYHTLKEGGDLKGKEYDKYSLESDCILRGSRVCIPKRYQKQILEELHSGHLGMVKMKAIARSYVYWKNIDVDIEEAVKNCYHCAKHKTDPPKVNVHHWEYPSMPWERIHIDFAGPIFEHMFLLVVDAYSKWLEVFPMRTITSTKTIECLRECFSRYGLPITLVSDNGPQLKSFEFESFLKSNGIKHKTCAPFKPSSNGQAERYVFTLKQSLRAMSEYPGNIRQKLCTFLMQHRKAPNMTTSQSPAMLFMKREIRTRIDLLRPDLKLDVENKLRKDIYFQDRVFNEGDRVAVRNYRQGDSKWKFGTVVSRDGQLHYTVNVNGQLWRRHTDQIRTVGERVREDVPHVSRMPLTKPQETVPPQPSVSVDVPCEETLPVSPDSVSGLTNSSTSSPIVLKGKPAENSSHTIPRRSGRIRKAPQRLNL